MKFALYFGNRGFFPASGIKAAREELKKAVEDAGHEALMLSEDATRYGAVETVEEGEKYAKFLKEHEGEYDGAIICLPNFGDENGAAAAFKDCNVPILIQAYDDDLDKMGPATRRDAFCGKFSIMDVFYQMRIPFTKYAPHTLNPTDSYFKVHLAKFASVCRIVKGMRSFNLGAIGARTTAFKTVRYDEVTLQNNGINVETFDMSDVFARYHKIEEGNSRVAQLMKEYAEFANFTTVPDAILTKTAKVCYVFEELIKEKRLDCIAVRCWPEIQEQLGISPCTILGFLNEKGIAAACELDVTNAIAMRALSLASDTPATVLDWNNNYKDEEDKCILFHCGPVAASMMQGKGEIQSHKILETTVGKENSLGPNVGRLKQGEFTYASAKTDEGALYFYAGYGEITDDPISDDFFGTCGVAQIDDLQDILGYVGDNGYKHHVALTMGDYAEELYEAFHKYLAFEIDVF